MYAVTVSVTRTLSDGYRRTRYSPTFFLHESVQGIVSKDHAERIAVHMFAEAMPDEDTAVIRASAVKVSS